MCVCGEASSSAEALAMLGKTRPDVVVVDIALPGPDGLGLIKQIKSLRPQCLMIVYSGHDELLYAERALAAGAHGYVMKQDPPQSLVNAIRRIMVGELVVGAGIANQLLHYAVGCPHPTATTGLDCLTDRELEIFRLIGRDCSRSEIAQQLRISVKTYEVHRTNIRKKLHLTNARELYRMAFQSQQTAH